MSATLAAVYSSRPGTPHPEFPTQVEIRPELETKSEGELSMSPQAKSRTQLAPDKTPLTESQATILGSLTGIDASKLQGHSIAEISTEYRWQIDPNLLLFVRVCGQVVKQDPATGGFDPVPFATVYAEETTCSVLGYFPFGLPWLWFFPFSCQTEVVAQTTTDPCGNFCFWVPRFIIEWILRFRIERICYLQLFTKPTVANIIAYLQGQPVGPNPGPEAQSAVSLTPNTSLYQKAEQLLGSQVVRQLASVGASKAFGAANPGQQALLTRPAFPAALAPTLPKEFRKPVAGASAKQHLTAVRSTLATNLGLNAKQLEGLDLNHYYGPFLRCYDIVVPEWVPILEVPDISFRVTQDVNGNGTQEVIYDGGLFEVPWAGNVSNVTLVASPIATSTTNCNTPNVVCGTVPALQYVGLMPLVNPALPLAPYINATTGFATRPNPPHPGGTLTEAGVPPSTAPYTETLQLYGCTNVSKAAYYRLRYTYTAPGSTTASALTPFTGLTWPLYREVGGTLQEQWPVADSNGWYPVINPADGWFPNSMVLEWDTINSAYNANGLYTIQLEVANSSKVLQATSAPIGFYVDNSVPVVSYSAIWSFNSDFSGAQPVPTDDCVVIDRGTTPQDVFVQVTYSVVANHLQSVQVGSGGCDGGATLYPVATTPAQLATQLATVQHWYEDAGDNTVSNVATYRIAASQPQGVYSFDVYAASRAFNPAGSDAGPLDDWNYNPTYVWTEPSFAIAIVNA
jgi:hypothetical protein